MKFELIASWRVWYKLWSIRLTAIGTLLAGWFMASPDAFLNVWLILPQELKDVLPPDVVKFIPIFILIAGTFSRVVKQNKLPQVNADDAPKS